jgi:hypothetical protein
MSSFEFPQTCEHRCAATKDCVLCKIFHSSSLRHDQCEQCPYKFEIIDDARSKMIYFN